MGRLELGLGFALGFRVTPPLKETTKGKGYKTQEVFLAC
jgi:hypothetical protein